MAALDFPNSPTVGQQYAAPNGATYQWDSAAWVIAGSAPAVPSGPAGGDLSGTYPNPSVSPVAKSKWVTSGANITPAVATNQVVVPGPTGTVDQSQLVLGTRTVKTHIESIATLNWGGVVVNAYYDGSNWHQDDASKPSWSMDINLDQDNFEVLRFAPGGAISSPLAVKNDGKTYCTLADTSVTKTMLAVRAACNTFVQANFPGTSPTIPITTWTKVLDVGTITVRGGLVLLFHNWSWAYVGNNNAQTIYVGFARNGTVINYVRNDFSGSGTGLSRWSIPAPMWLEGPPAGTYLYSIYMYVANSNGAVNVAGSDVPGVATVMELS